MTPEAKEKLLADAIALRADIEGLIERIDTAGENRSVNPFFARWLARTLLHDRNALNHALDVVIFSTTLRQFPDREIVWNRLANAYEAASFALSYAWRIFEEET